jgi:hypothetical protein
MVEKSAKTAFCDAKSKGNATFLGERASQFKRDPRENNDLRAAQAPRRKAAKIDAMRPSS